MKGKVARVTINKKGRLMGLTAVQQKKIVASRDPQSVIIFATTR
jgi:hypothetical protein